MTPAWQPDWVVTSDLAKSLIETAFPALNPASVEEFGVGWDNTVFLVNNSLVFRFPRRRIAVPLIETEIDAYLDAAGQAVVTSNQVVLPCELPLLMHA